MTKTLCIIMVICLVCVGCESIDSIKIGVGYTGEEGTKLEGDVEVVLSKLESDYVGLNVLESVENPDEKFMVLNQKEISKIIEKLEPEKKSVLSISPRKKLAEFLQSN